MDQPQDLLLFKALQNDSRQALNQLYRLYFNPLCHFVDTLTQDNMLAEEIVSDVFFNLWVKRNALQIKSSLKAYLFKACRNQAISYMRKPALNFDHIEEDNFYTPPIEPDQILLQQESAELIESLINLLPVRTRLVFNLHRKEELTYKEIAELLEISEKTVEYQMSKALKTLRELYTKTRLFKM
jgi:RNA polymerase sigma-70 factor (ECF subfamily)